MHSGTVLAVSPDQMPPDDLLEKVMKAFPTTFGIAGVADGEKWVTAEVVRPTPPLDEIKIWLDEFKKGHRLVFFGNFPDDSPLESCQPFVLLTDDEKNNLLAACLDGDFPGYASDNSRQSQEWGAALTHIAPGLMRQMRMTKGDLPAIFEDFKDPITAKNYENMMVQHGSIAFLGNTGEIWSFHKGDRKKDFDWGWMSNPGDHEELSGETSEYPSTSLADKPADAPKKEYTTAEKTKLRVAAKKAGIEIDAEGKWIEAIEKLQSESGGSSDHGNVADTKPVNQQKEVTPLTEAELKSIPDAEKYIFVEETFTPDRRLEGRALRRAYTDRGIKVEDLSAGWETKKPSVKVKSRKLKPMAELRDYLNKRAAGTIRNTTVPPAPKPATALPPTQGKDTSPHHIPQPSETSKGAVVVSNLVLSADEKRAATNWYGSGMVKKWIDASSQEIAEDPEAIIKAELKRPTLAKQMGLAGEDATIPWKMEALLSLGGTSLKALALLVMDWRYRALKAENLVKIQANPPSEKKEEPKMSAAERTKARLAAQNKAA